MSKTIVDMPKVTQMLDAGWSVRVWKNPLGTYSASAIARPGRVRDVLHKLRETYVEAGADQSWADFKEMHLGGGGIITDDFTPEQALTRLAYKVHGEVL